jgi:hypothetical protein
MATIEKVASTSVRSSSLLAPSQHHSHASAAAADTMLSVNQHAVVVAPTESNSTVGSLNFKDDPLAAGQFAPLLQQVFLNPLSFRSENRLFHVLNFFSSSPRRSWQHRHLCYRNPTPHQS